MGMFFKKINNPLEEAVRHEVMCHLMEINFRTDIDRYTWISAEGLKNACPSLKPMFDGLELNDTHQFYDNIVAAGIVTLVPGGKILTHIDTTPPMINFNIPLYGTGRSTTRFFKGKLVNSSFTPGEGVRGIVGEDLELLEEYELDKSTWHLAKVLHGVQNGDQYRAIVSFKFKRDPLELFFK